MTGSLVCTGASPNARSEGGPRWESTHESGHQGGSRSRASRGAPGRTSSRRRHRRPPAPRRAASAQGPLRLHRRWRRGRGHPQGELPGLRAGDLAPALGGGDACVRSPDHGPRHDARSAISPGPRGQQPDVLPERRSGGRARGRRCRHRLHPLDLVGDAAGRDQGGHERPRVVSGLPRRRARGHHLRPQARPRGGLLGNRGHHRHAGGGPARARRPERREQPRLARVLVHGPRPARTRLPPALAGGLPRGRRPDELPQRRAPRPGPDAVRRRGRGPRAVDGELGRSAAGSATPGKAPS